MILTIIGWMVILLISLWLSAITIGGSIVSKGFSGKIGSEMFIFLILSIAAWSLCYYTFPFEVVIK
ncbi:hypothetical protein D3C85_1091210 [compost metagenome]